ncbi:MAG TPA: cell surface protein SprA, partial [Ignavibacteriaceae bacterium]
SLEYLLTDEFGNERIERDIWNDILGGDGFGEDYQYQQSIDFRTSPRLPSLWDINRYFTLNAGYSSGYRWDYNLTQPEIGRSAGYSRKFTAGMILRWKSLTEPIFAPGTEEKETGNKNTQTKPEETLLDSTGNVVEKPKGSGIGRAFSFLIATIKAVFFDWENFTINYSYDNGVSKSGIKAFGTGFKNFWGITQDPENGPGRLFQLGLSNDVGPRALSETTNLSDVFSERNTVDFKTARPLWEGAKIDVSWNVGWSVNQNTTLRSNALGNIEIVNVTSTGSLNRSFLSLPSGFLPFVESGITKVNDLYNQNAPDPRASLSQAFIEGFETFPFLSTLPVFADYEKYVPRPNWRLSWDGLEKILFFKSIAQRITLDHSYASTYTEGWKLTTEGKRELQSQRIEYGFSPLIGLNITFGEMFGGNLTGNVKFSSRTTYDLGLTTTNITETSSADIGITAGYSKSGFEMPLFGISLKNDIEFLFSYTTTQNETLRFEMNNFIEEGIPQDGTTRTTIEPRIKYTISSKVTLSIFYKRSSVEPKGAARIPPTTTNEAGLDVNIVIQ